MIALMDIIRLWADRLGNDADLNSWVRETYGRALRIFVGFDPKDKPGRRHAPFVVLQPQTGLRGRETEACAYVVWLVLGVLDDALHAVGPLQDSGAERSEMLGLSRLDRELTDRIMAVLEEASASAIPGEFEERYSTEDFPLLVKEMDLTVTVPTLLGGTVQL